MSVAEKAGGTQQAQTVVPPESQTDKSQVSSTTPQSFTQETQEAAVHAALSAAGRDAKQAEVNKAEATRLATERATLDADKEKARKAKEEAELEAAQGNPDLLDVYKLKHTLNAREADLAKREEDLAKNVKANEEKVAAAEATKKEITIWNIAQKHTLDASTLKTKAEELSLTTDEQIVSLAKAMSESKDTTGLHVDSGKTTGAGFTPDKDNPDETLKRGFQQVRK